SDSIEIYLREFVSPNGQTQKAQLISASLDRNGRVEGLINTNTQQEIAVSWLEPETLAQLGNSEQRATTPKTLKDLSAWLPKALVAVEDERFFTHFGVDPIAIARAFAVNLKSGSVRQGGSTLTQQLAKNLFYGREKTLTRKIKEAVAAILIETAFSKNEILELYLNEVFLGQEGSTAIHGFGEAALYFFGKDASTLDISESATLVGIIKAPSYYSPKRHPARARKRRDIVLGQMLRQEVITQTQYSKAKDTPLKIQGIKRTKRIAPYHLIFEPF
ncbi:UNVERIFIED_CONTAM: hypothetical protein GTU68_043803, partial [Idotea baltica]|nr:hypothetical protein [Idotea baltica]